MQVKFEIFIKWNKAREINLNSINNLKYQKKNSYLLF